jgi:hypothetical protein
MVDFVAQNSIHRFGPSVVGHEGVTNMEEIVLYRHHAPDVPFTAYASAKHADMVAFGLPNGIVRVMGGVVATQFVHPNGAAVVAPPLPALPRYFEYLIKTAVLKLAFSPDGTSLAILYRSCLVVQSVTNSNVKRVYYFGTEHSRIFLDLIHSDESVFLRELNGRVCRFSLVDGSFGHEVPPVTFDNVSYFWTVLDSCDKIITYDPATRRMRYMALSTTTHTYEFPDGLFLGDALPVGFEPEFFMGSDEDESLFWIAGPDGVQIFRTSTGESLATCRTNVLQDTTKFLVGFRALYAADQVGEVVRSRKFIYESTTHEIVVTDEREVPFGDGKELMELSRHVSLLTTRFQAARPLYILQPLRIQNIVLNSHMFPVDDDDETETETGSDDEDEGDADDESEEGSDASAPPAAVLAASFHFPQPLHGLQRIISLTRNCVEHADAYTGIEAWSPEDFHKIRAACNRPGAVDVHYYPAKRLYGRSLMVIADVKEVIQKIDVEIQKFVDFYGATATFGQFEFDADDAEGSEGDPYGFKRDFEVTTAAEHVAVDLDEFLVIPDGGRLKFVLNRVTLVEAIHDEGLVPLDAVNTGVISTLNCMKSQFKDVLSACIKCARGAKRLFTDMRVARRRSVVSDAATVANGKDDRIVRRRKAE